MRTLLTLLLSACCLLAFGHNSTYEKLCEVNKCWAEQKDINRQQLPAHLNLDEGAWIKLHLSLVEKTLRSRSTENQTATQKQNRANCLDHLHEYWMAGRFPINEDYSFRTPIFIDKHDNFCAVGYLVKASGHEAVSRMIAAKTNLAYVRQMHYPELNAWAEENGFTIDELAWIQPGYPASCYADHMGQGTDGQVNALLYDDQTQQLLVGGHFTTVDGNIPAINIANVTEDNELFTWHKMGSVPMISVNTFAKYDNKIYAGGDIIPSNMVAHPNICYWDGTAWQPVSYGLGSARSLAVYNGVLYAAGEFGVAGGTGNSNFAKWTGTAWQEIPGLDGSVNTMEVWNGQLVLGGAFKYNGSNTNIIQWNAVNGFSLFTNTIANEVTDLQSFKGELYAATKYTSGTDMELIKKLSSGLWVDQPVSLAPALSGNFSVNALYADSTNLIAGGEFMGGITIGSFTNNCRTVIGSSDWFAVDDAINTLALFKNKLVAGGRFKHDITEPGTDLNSIGYKKDRQTAVPLPRKEPVFSLYPNPVAGSLIDINGIDDNTTYVIYNVQGQKLLSGTTGKTINIGALPSGNYLIKLRDQNITANMKFVKE